MTRVQSRFLSGEQVQTAAGWDFAAVDQASERFAAKLRAQAEEEARTRDEGLRQSGYSQGYSEGHAKGYAEGFALGQSQATEKGQRQLREYIENQGRTAADSFSSLIEQAQVELAQAEQAMAQGVLELALEIARQVVRREIASNPNVLQPVIREALEALESENKTVAVRMHPTDAEVLAQDLAQSFSALDIKLVPDATLHRGGCRLESAGTVVDGTLPTRWRRVAASLGLESRWEDEDASHA